MFRNIGWFVRNVWRYRKQLWRFRTWDWQHNYEWFFESLRDTRDAIDKYGHHERKDKDVRGINVVLARWEQYKTAWDEDVKLGLEKERYAWHRMHRTLERYARHWWD